MGEKVARDTVEAQALGKQRKGKLFSTQRDRGNLISQMALELGEKKTKQR